MMPNVPKVPMPKRARKSDGRTPMKGRPITTEEFERMLDKVPDIVGWEPHRPLRGVTNCPDFGIPVCGSVRPWH